MNQDQASDRRSPQAESPLSEASFPTGSPGIARGPWRSLGVVMGGVLSLGASFSEASAPVKSPGAPDPVAKTRGVVTPESSAKATFDHKAVAESLDRLLSAESSKFSGAFFARRGGEVVLQKGYGHADPNDTVPNTETTLYDVASLAKPFTSLAILLLEHDGKLSTDDLISKHLPNVPETYAGVTIHHLLTHTSGAPRKSGAWGTDLPQAVEKYFSMEPLASPGARYEYWNGGYALLSAIVEKVSGESWETFCHERIFKPAGMRQSGFCGEDFAPEAIVATGHSVRMGDDRPAAKDPYFPWDAFGYEYRGMGGLISSVAELAKWHTWLTEGGVPETVLNKMTTPTKANPAYGCGWEVFRFPDGTVCHGHGGSVAGFVCKLWTFPERDNAMMVIISNRDDFDYKLLGKLKERLFGESQ